MLQLMPREEQRCIDGIGRWNIGIWQHLRPWSWHHIEIVLTNRYGAWISILHLTTIAWNLAH